MLNICLLVKLEIFDWHLDYSDFFCFDTNPNSKYNCRAVRFACLLLRNCKQIFMTQLVNAFFNTQAVS